MTRRCPSGRRIRRCRWKPAEGEAASDRDIKENIMLLPLTDRSIAYDLMGPENAPVVCMTHSLASDGGMWAEQVPPLLAAGFRVLSLDMRGHGGSGPVPGDYTMSDLAGDVAVVLDALSIARVHFIGLSIGGMLGQA